jgi:hypothetical protein
MLCTKELKFIDIVHYAEDQYNIDCKIIKLIVNNVTYKKWPLHKKGIIIVNLVIRKNVLSVI